MLNKINYSSYYERSTVSNVQHAHGIKEGYVSCDTKEKRVLSYDTKEENINEIVISFLLECLSVCTRFSISVGFFFAY